MECLCRFQKVNDDKFIKFSNFGSRIFEQYLCIIRSNIILITICTKLSTKTTLKLKLYSNSHLPLLKQDCRSLHYKITRIRKSVNSIKLKCKIRIFKLYSVIYYSKTITIIFIIFYSRDFS